MSRRVKVAVVGSGLAGLTAAWLLESNTWEGVQFETHLFEQAETIGMDMFSVSIPKECPGEHSRIDVPMRSFQGGYYRELINLYRRLDVEFHKADFSYSFSRLTRAAKYAWSVKTTFIYNGASGRAGLSRPHNNGDTGTKGFRGFTAIVVLSFILSSLITFFHYLRLSFLSAPVFRPGPSVTFDQWATRTAPQGILARWSGVDKSWLSFTREVMIPIFSAVCTAPEDDIRAHPAAEILDYVWLTLGTHHYVVTHGVREVVKRLSEVLRHVHISTAVQGLDEDPSDRALITVKTNVGDFSGFDHIILATQAHRAARILSAYSDSSSRAYTIHQEVVRQLVPCLETFKYRRNIVVNHTDEKLLPSDIRDRRDLNLVHMYDQPPPTSHTDSGIKYDGLTVPPSFTMATHILTHTCGSSLILQTTNPTVSPEKILSVAAIDRAVLTVQSKEALQALSAQNHSPWPFASGRRSKLGRLQGTGKLHSKSNPGIWICGSYAYHGIPLLEQCVASARQVVQQGVLASEGIEWLESPW